MFETGFYPKILISGDYSAFSEGFNGHGAYMVSGLYESQTFRLPIYIGGTKNLEKRITIEHIPLLRSNNHTNNPLQRSWNKYGEENFVWWLLEISEKDQHFETEQKYLDYYHPFVDEFGGFNIAKSATKPALGRKMSEEEKERKRIMSLGEKNPFYGRSHSLETRLKMKAKRNLRFTPLPKGEKAKLSKPFKFINPSGVLVEGLGLENFCFENNLIHSHMRAVRAGKRKSHKGWTKAPEF